MLFFPEEGKESIVSKQRDVSGNVETYKYGRGKEKVR